MIGQGGTGRGQQGSKESDHEAVAMHYLDTEGAAQYLGVTEREVDELRRHRKISFFRLGYRTIRFLAANLDRDLERLKVKAVGE